MVELSLRGGRIVLVVNDGHNLFDLDHSVSQMFSSDGFFKSSSGFGDFGVNGNHNLIVEGIISNRDHNVFNFVNILSHNSVFKSHNLFELRLDQRNGIRDSSDFGSKIFFVQTKSFFNSVHVRFFEAKSMDGSIIVDDGGFIDIVFGAISPGFEFSGVRFREVLVLLFQGFESVLNSVEDRGFGSDVSLVVSGKVFLVRSFSQDVESLNFIENPISLHNFGGFLGKSFELFSLSQLFISVSFSSFKNFNKVFFLEI
jgi:hypothetical protein